MTSLSDLVTSQTKSEVLDRILHLFRSASFPTSSWQPFSLIRHLVEYLSENLGDLSGLIAAIAKGGYLDTAEGAWLTLLAKSLYNEDRKAAVTTKGIVRLTDAASSGPHTVVVGQWWVAETGSTRRYKVTALPNGATLTLAGSLDVEVEAESAGADYNIASSTLSVLLTPGGTGVTVSNPAGSSGTWITQQGADEETDVALRQRCRDKWGTIGSGSVESSYRYHATTTSAEVTRVRVFEDPATGRVTVVVAGPSGPVSSGAATDVNTVLQAKRPLTVTVLTQNAVVESVTITTTVYLTAGAVSATVLAAVRAAVDAYARASDIGGEIAVSEIIAAIQGVPGVRKVGVVTAPSGDIVLAADRVFVPTYNLSSAA